MTFTNSDISLLLKDSIEDEEKKIFFSDIKDFSIDWIFDKERKEQENIFSSSLVGSLSALAMKGFIDDKALNKCLNTILNFSEGGKYCKSILSFARKEILNEQEKLNMLFLLKKEPDLFLALANKAEEKEENELALKAEKKERAEKALSEKKRILENA